MPVLRGRESATTMGLFGGATLLAALSVPLVARADYSDFAEVEGGATRGYSNAAGDIAWENYLGDWADADGVAQGERPFAEVPATSAEPRIEIDVTDLVSRWASGELHADGFFVRAEGSVTVHAREATDPMLRPALLLETGSGEVSLEPEADTYLDGSTYRALGGGSTLSLARALLRFPRASIVGATITRARLVLHATRISGSPVVRVFACRQPRVVMPVEHGIAAEYDHDRGLADHPDVYTFVDFSGDSWTRAEPLWRYRSGVIIDESDADDVANGFEPIDGPAVRWGFVEGGHGGGNSTLAFPPGEQPDELYSRYYLRAGRNFTPTVQGGKMPGFSYRPEDGSRLCNGGDRDLTGLVCWSSRGSFSTIAPAGNPLAGFFHLGWYVYHPNQAAQTGDHWPWNIGYDAQITEGRWYSVEEYVRVNSAPHVADGVLRAWVNGRLAFDKTDVLLRNSLDLHVGEVWYNIYHGGRLSAPHDMYFWVDNIVVARSYIGPMGGVPDAPPLLSDGEIGPAPTRDGGTVPVDEDGGIDSIDGAPGRADGGLAPDAAARPSPPISAGCGCSATSRGELGGAWAALIGLVALHRRARRRAICRAAAR
jgi:MYXO-CTERM domain-containing protein